MKPLLPYPNPLGNCKECELLINERDFFGFLFGYLFCTKCYKYFRHIRKPSFEQRYEVKIETFIWEGKKKRFPRG